MKKQEIYSLISWNAFVVSYLITFIYLFMNLSQRTGSKDLFLEIALDSRALLYGFLIFILFKEGRSEDKKTILNKEVENQVLGPEEIYAFFREAGLTKREAEIARLARNGLSNREIAEEMYIAETTVKKHMSHIFEKLLIKSREELKEIVRVGRHKND
ncbi:MAG: helix-turn-helix transcriptional regulator [Clostridiales bacterium]|nr:helix-turn-helix transcriptional regulator [Clostridiales bacterium]